MDIAAGLLNVTAQNYAVGGATSGAVTGVLGIPRGFANRTAATSINVPSTLEQVRYIELSPLHVISKASLYDHPVAHRCISQSAASALFGHGV